MKLISLLLLIQKKKMGGINDYFLKMYLSYFTLLLPAQVFMNSTKIHSYQLTVAERNVEYLFPWEVCLSLSD